MHTRRHPTYISGIPCHSPIPNSRLGEVLFNISSSSWRCVLWLPNFLYLILCQEVKLHSHQLFPSQRLCVSPFLLLKDLSFIHHSHRTGEQSQSLDLKLNNHSCKSGNVFWHRVTNAQDPDFFLCLQRRNVQ